MSYEPNLTKGSTSLQQMRLVLLTTAHICVLSVLVRSPGNASIGLAQNGQ